MQVWKYSLGAGVNRINMPRGAEILTIQLQGSAVCLWAKVDPAAADRDPRIVVVVGTGHEMPTQGELRYISTFQLQGGALVFHAFEVVDATL